MKKLLFSIVIAAVMFMICQTSQASMSNGLFRLHLDSTLVDFGKGEREFENDNTEYPFEGITLGTGLSKMGLGFGFTLGRGFVLGARFALGQESFDFAFDSEELFLWSVLPYLEYVFLRNTFRPFLMAQAGIEGVNSDPMRFWGVNLGAGGGAHFFVLNKMSIDLTMLLSYRFGTGETGANTGDRDFNHWRFGFAILFGMSGWF